MRPIIRDVANTGGKASAGSRLTVVARSEGATVRWTEAVELTAGSVMAAGTIRFLEERIPDRIPVSRLFSAPTWSCIGDPGPPWFSVGRAAHRRVQKSEPGDTVRRQEIARCRRVGRIASRPGR